MGKVRKKAKTKRAGAKKVKEKKIKKRSNLKVKYVPLSKLKEWDKNPRMNDEAADKLCGLLQEHGFINPIIATPDGTIRAGHTRFKAAQKLGLKEIPVIYVPFAGEAEAEMYSIADNKSSEWAEWNRDLLGDLLKQKRGVNVGALERMSGFNTLEIEGLSSKTVDFAAKTFAEAVEDFQQKNPKEIKKEFWAWVLLPGEKEFESLLSRTRKDTGRSKVHREMDFAKMFKILGLKVGGVCPDCKGLGARKTDKGSAARLRCVTCNGSGHVTLGGKTAKRKKKSC